MDKINDPQIEAFLQFLKTEKNFSHHTLRNYQLDLIDLVEFISKQFPKLVSSPQVHWDRIDAHTLRSYLAQAYGRLKTTSLARHIASLRSFYHFLAKQRIVQANLAQELSLPKLPKTLPKFLDEEEAARMMEGSTEDSFSARRDRAIVELFYSSGLRIGELVQLKVSDLDLKEAVVRARGKGRKERIVPIGRWAITAIEKYLEVRPQLCIQVGNEEILFLGVQGKKIHPSVIAKMLQTLAQKIGLSKKSNPSYAKTQLCDSSDEPRG